ncbi:hypothetical protein B4U80_09409 [Leptotrombidium deliense]|uniref:Uncharacterized protein n=1 Tax=Leptotrombidium deliense TaxID=299467 RepID=A0A443S0H6_9ACAR|nr:hypothetical protein B4U80_09409 [Leptotrombidium deliense]
MALHDSKLSMCIVKWMHTQQTSFFGGPSIIQLKTNK